MISTKCGYQSCLIYHDFGQGKFSDAAAAKGKTTKLESTN